MKKIVISMVALLIAFSLVLVKAPNNVLATGSGTWLLIPSSVASSVVNVDSAASFAPSWLQQLSEGVALTAPAKICYPFRSGQFHWIPQIMQLTGNTWKSVSTTKEYLYGVEGSLYACAVPANGGTFALFGYYSGPVERSKIVSGNVCPEALSVDEWTYNSNPRDGGAMDFNNLNAVGINWTSCPDATTLGWGMRMCWNGDCHEYDVDTLSISAATYPNPQNLTEAITDDSWMLIYPQGSEDICEFKPYIRLLDSGGNVLDILYDLEFPDMCVS